MNEKCPCQGDYLDKFIQPSILMLLCERPGHGFYLLNEVKDRRLVEDVDATGFYRALMKLEQGGCVTSQWLLEAGQKPRKEYSITSVGQQCLRNWQNTLSEYQIILDRLATAIGQSLSLQKEQAN